MKLNFIVTGALLMTLAVISGAFGAHGLRDRISVEMLEIWEKAVFYQVIHAIGMLLIGVLLQKSESRLLSVAGIFFLFGTVFFSGSLYLLSLREISFTNDIASVLGPITPLGGLCFISGWILLTVFGLKNPEAIKK